MAENIERIFQDEIREKKRAGSGAFHMRGKGVKHGFSGALRTPYHFMKKKERDQLSGAVEVSNVYSSILNWEEWCARDKETQKLLMTKWREIYSNTEIQEQLQVGRGKAFNSQSFADIVNDLGCPKKTHIPGNKKPERKKIAAITSSPQLEFEIGESIRPIREEVQTVLITNGLHLQYNGEYDQEQLNKIFTKLQLLIDGESNKFKISLSLSEVVE